MNTSILGQKLYQIPKMKFGLIRERKNPPDRRVVLSPQACRQLLNQFPDLEILVEPSPIRVFSDSEYEAEGITVSDQMEDCEVLLGVKEVPIESLIPNKKYFFFSHTIKKQPYNRDLLRAILQKNIELYDHEVITNAKGQRLVAFGRYAGIVGAYNGIRAWGMRKKAFALPKAETLKDQQALIDQLKTAEMGQTKIVLTGKGRVGMGAKEMLDGMGFREVSSEEFLEQEFPEAVYTQIDVLDYNAPIDGSQGSREEFFAHPEKYKSTFFGFAKNADLFIAGHFHNEKAPFLYTRADVKHPDNRIQVVADISCDIDGPVAPTLKASTIADPLYGYDPESESVVEWDAPEAVTVMAVDNLPCELPRDASEGFGAAFASEVIPCFFNGDHRGILQRARMTKQGELTSAFVYLQDYVEGA